MGEYTNNRKSKAVIYIDGSNKEALLRFVDCISEADAFMEDCKKIKV